MANGAITEEEAGPTDPGGGGAQGATPDGGGSMPGLSGPPTGGPVMSALQRQMQGPQPSSPGPGNQADAMNKISMALQMIQSTLPSLPAGSPLHKDALGAVQRLSRHLGQGFAGPGAGVQKTAIGDMLRDTIRNFMAARMQGQGGGGAGGPPGGGGAGQYMPPGAPSPSTPLPGA